MHPNVRIVAQHVGVRGGAMCRGRWRAAIFFPALLHVLLASIFLCGVGATASPPHHDHSASPAGEGGEHSSAQPGAAGPSDQEAPSQYTVYPLLLAAAIAAFVIVSVTHPSLSGSIRLLAPKFAVGFACMLHTLKLGVPLEYWAHVAFGVVCLAAGAVVERTGQPVQVHPVQGGIGACIFLSLIIGEYLSVGFGRLHYVAHALLELDCLLLTLSAVSESLVSAAASRMTSRTADEGATAHAAALLRVRTARAVMDPCGLVAISVIFVRHRHDPSPLAVAFHHVQSGLLLLLALAVAAVAAAAAQPVTRRARQPESSPVQGAAAGPALRVLHTLCWFVNGAWLMLMAALMYLWPGRQGLHHLIYPNEDPTEATTVYLALTLLASALAVTCLTLRGTTDERRAEPTAQSAADLREADELSGEKLLGPANVP